MGVEMGRRLVEQIEPGVAGKCARQTHSLLLAAGQFCRAPMRQRCRAQAGPATRPPTRGHHVGGGPPGASGTRRCPARADAARARIAGTPCPLRGLRAAARRRRGHAVSGQPDLTPGRIDETGHRLQQRRLARSRRAEQRHDLAVLDGQVEIAQGGYVAVVDAQAAALQRVRPLQRASANSGVAIIRARGTRLRRTRRAMPRRVRGAQATTRSATPRARLSGRCRRVPGC